MEVLVVFSTVAYPVYLHFFFLFAAIECGGKEKKKTVFTVISSSLLLGWNGKYVLLT